MRQKSQNLRVMILNLILNSKKMPKMSLIKKPSRKLIKIKRKDNRRKIRNWKKWSKKKSSRIKKRKIILWALRKMRRINLHRNLMVRMKQGLKIRQEAQCQEDLLLATAHHLTQRPDLISVYSKTPNHLILNSKKILKCLCRGLKALNKGILSRKIDWSLT